jgi:hypothetical protein
MTNQNNNADVICNNLRLNKAKAKTNVKLHQISFKKAKTF